jgi:hypothetical protein
MAIKKKSPARKSTAAPAAASKAAKYTKYVPLLILLGIGFFTVQTYIMRKAAEAQTLVFHYIGREAERGVSLGAVMGCYDQQVDKSGNFYIADDLSVPFGNTRIQKFGPDGKPLAAFKPKNAREAITNGHYLAVDSKGRVFVREENTGGLVRLTPDLKYDTRWERKLDGTLGIAVNSKDQILVADGNTNSILFLDGDGGDISRLPLKKDTVASTSRMQALDDGRIILFGGDAGKPVVRVVEKDGNLAKKFEIKDVSYCPFTLFGVDPQGRLYVNDLIGRLGVAVYNLEGKYIGAAKTADNEFAFESSGGLCVSQWDGTVYMNTVTGIQKLAYADKKK